MLEFFSFFFLQELGGILYDAALRFDNTFILKLGRRSSQLGRFQSSHSKEMAWQLCDAFRHHPFWNVVLRLGRIQYNVYRKKQLEAFHLTLPSTYNWVVLVTWSASCFGLLFG